MGDLNEEEMDSNDIDARFEKFEDEFLKFNRIPKKDRRHHRPDICAMIYIDEKYPSKKGNDIIAGADHDVVWLEAGDLDKLTDDDIVYLQRCGVHYSSETDSLAMFC